MKKKNSIKLVREWDSLIQRSVSVFECSSCGSTQTYAPKGMPGGITKKEAEEIGWQQTGKTLTCPSCRKER